MSFPFPGELPNPGIKPGSPALQVYSLPSEQPGKPHDGISVLIRRRGERSLSSFCEHIVRRQPYSRLRGSSTKPSHAITLISDFQSPELWGNKLKAPVYGASLVAQLVRNLSAMRETWFRSLGWEDSLEEGMATHSTALAWSIPMDRGTWWASPWGRKQLDTPE